MITLVKEYSEVMRVAVLMLKSKPTTRTVYRKSACIPQAKLSKTAMPMGAQTERSTIRRKGTRG